jgi:hypothetical protein
MPGEDEPALPMTLANDDLVTVEAMGFTWRLPRAVVAKDIASGFAIQLPDPE